MSEWITCPKCGVLYKGEHSCPKEVATATKKFPREIPVQLAILSDTLDHLATFELEVDMDEWVDLYLEASKRLGKVLGRSTAEHLWGKFRDMGIIRMWGLLDKDNRDIFVMMLNLWIAMKYKR